MKTTKKLIIAALMGLACSAANAASPLDMVGGWQLTNANINGVDLPPGMNAVATFMADGTYMLATDFVSPYNPADNGMERGTFSWNQAGGQFSSNTLVDTNGQSGFSHTAGPQTVAINGNTMYATGSDGDFTWTRVASSTNPLVGSWSLSSWTGNGVPHAALTFMADGTWTLAAELMNGGGMERGTYSFDQQSGVFSITKLVHTGDPNWGMTGQEQLLAFNGNVMTVASQGGQFTWTHVTPPVPEPETYAMLLAGLGLMGVVGRRRRSSAA